MNMKPFIVCGLIGITIGGFVYYAGESKKADNAAEEIVVYAPSPAALERFYEQTVTDPVFALPGLDLDTYEERFISLQTAFESHLTFFDSYEAEIIRNGLYPLEGLSLVAEMEQARRDFLSTQDTETAKHYHNSLRTVLNSYISNIGNLKILFKTTPYIEMQMSNGETGTEHLIRQIKLIESDLVRALGIVDARYDCLQSNEECPIGATTNTALAIGASTQVNTPKLTKTEQEILEALRQHEPSVTEPRVPVILERSQCVPLDEPVGFYSWDTRSPLSSLVFGRVNELHDLYFHDVSKDEEGYFKMLADFGNTYSIQLNNPYRCADYEYDAAKVRTIERIHADIKTMKIIATSTQESDLFNTEQLVRNATTSITETEIINYLFALESLTEKMSASEIDSLYGEDVKEKIDTLLLLWYTQSAGYERELTHLEDMMRTLKEILPYSHIPQEAIILIRNYISTTYFLPNQTLYQSPIYLTESRFEIPLEDTWVTSFNKQLRGQYSLDELFKENIIAQQRLSEELGY